MRFSRIHLPLTGILLVAFALRVYGSNFGLPYEYHVDEVQYVRQAASMGAEGLKPIWWNNPPFYKYILLGEYAALFLFGRVVGWYSSAAEFGTVNSLDPTILYLLARTTSAILGTATVLVVYLSGHLAYGRRTGLISAAFLSAAFLHVRDSHFAVNDIALTFFMAVAVLASIGIAKTGGNKWYVTAGAALGLGFATKYSSVFSLGPIVAAHLLARYAPIHDARPVSWRQPILLTVVATVTAVVASPYFVIVPSIVLQDAYEALYLAGRSGFEGWQIAVHGGYYFYLETLVRGIGWPLAAAAFAGLFFSVIRHTRYDTVLLALPVLLYAVAGRQEMYFARFILPVIPPLLVIAAFFMDILLHGLFSDLRQWYVPIAIGVVLVIAAPSLAASLRLGHLLAQTDTRTLAARWIGENIPAGAKIALDWPFHGPPLASVEHAMPDSTQEYDVTEVGGSGLSSHPVEYYQTEGYEYLIVSGNVANLHRTNPVEDAERQEFYRSLGERFDVIWEVSPAAPDTELPFVWDEIYGPFVSIWQRERPGPELKIYQVRP